MPSNLEERFASLWKTLKGPSLEEEYAFHPTRKFRFDFCHVGSKVAIELEGGVWVRGRHTRPAGFIKDCEKYNLAASLGWLVFRLPDNFVTAEWINVIKQAIKDRNEK